MMCLALWASWLAFKKRNIFWFSEVSQGHGRGATPLGFIATEMGWVATEVGRQPWVVVGYLKTSQAVTPMPGLLVPLVFFGALYVFLTCIVIWLMVRHVSATPTECQMPCLSGRSSMSYD